GYFLRKCLDGDNFVLPPVRCHQIIRKFHHRSASIALQTRSSSHTRLLHLADSTVDTAHARLEPWRYSYLGCLLPTIRNHPHLETRHFAASLPWAWLRREAQVCRFRS